MYSLQNILYYCTIFSEIVQVDVEGTKRFLEIEGVNLRKKGTAFSSRRAHCRTATPLLTALSFYVITQPC